ncbi:MAG: bifunctional precorrin-2 dehydrogenase/sirohydrochlorin ferrochelatase [Candidatus Omnitrophica bacterium]|nr:bifunctional precorrin-2 dehydrogenase/sirohydrochlorin ferrochelatase [Candidatus Omnitrophota bacterium]
MTRSYYPIFADLTGRRCVVIGGGPVAQRKVTTLLGYGAQVIVVSPTVTPQLSALARRGRITYRTRRFRPADLAGAWLVYAATGDERVNRRVEQAATRACVFANIVDQTARCTFIAPSIFRRGQVTIAVSTGGVSPSLSKHVRRDLARTIGAEYARMLQLLGRLRGAAKQRLPDYQDRGRYFDELMTGQTFRLIRAGKTQHARQVATQLLMQYARRVRR